MIEHDGVELMGARFLQARLGIGDHVHLKARPLQVALRQAGDPRIVIDVEHTDRLCGHAGAQVITAAALS